ncbi:MAG: oligosaccharide flippase family protein [Candidatus Eremiobacteraeota bacterium]|nr:oligosaccharide flippase family protein [Candidatus Eremiobacteraeota bacterium]
MSLRNKLFADGLYWFVFRMANMGIAALLGILTARFLGPHGRGIYSLPVVAFAVATAAFPGLNSAVAYFLLRRKAGRGTVSAALKCAAIFVAGAVPVVVAIAYGMHAPWAAIPAILALPSPAIIGIVNGFQIGLDRVRMVTQVAVFNTLFLLMLMLAAFALLGHVPVAAIASWVVGQNLFALGALIWMLRKSRSLPEGSVSTREFLTYSLRVGAVSLISLLNYRADVFIVAALGGPTLLGMYTLAVTAAEMLLATTQVTANVSSPQIGGMESSSAAAQLTARLVRNNVIIASVTCALLWVFAPIAVGLLYGHAFLPMIPAFRVLLIGVFAMSLGSPMSTYFTIRLGRPQVPMILAGLSATICVVVSFLLVGRLGLVGAAIGSTLGYVIGQSIAIAYFTRVANLRVSLLLLPRWSDLTAYALASGSIIRRLKRAA